METEKNTLDDMMGKRPELVVGRNYKVAPYPLGWHPMSAMYLGKENRVHIFISYNKFWQKDKEGERKYLFLNDNWIRDIKGIITYPLICSDSFFPLSKESIIEDTESSRRSSELSFFDKLEKIEKENKWEKT